ncbi:efflux transporter outer membrane subunit [Gilvimarinus sp. SDUM040013]|uniref:Efflux transporter outer membrane subunit n=1 Tax=Gilvimarinus gilvus TaxID=3058038 RepID=A0ABU4RZS5_9GAMM|nr:efflux transporter outer membrane subunit [Gilvimarinus sp. SDUM040013]MDO3384786.1 efflux transporter outer membrane subunit [Gilvimarinus sp. SDUM040013]MDX6850396.1 efflux transporter outer membrane subunit [Gilvimarinus sp. SDUM040013]
MNLCKTVKITCAAAAFLLAGCAPLGPDFKAPDTDWLAEWEPELYGQLQQDPAALNLSQWWTRLNDPLLNNLMLKARLESPTMRVAGLRILESRAVLGVASGLYYPQVQQVSASGAYVGQKRGGGTYRDFTSSDAAFNLGWEMDFWGRFRRSVESADAAYFASLANHRDVQVLLSAQVANLYFAIKTTLQRIEIAQSNLALQRRSYEITEQLFTQGQDSELDLQQAKAQYLSTQASIPGLKLALQQQRNALGVLLGRAPNDLPELADIDSKLPQLDAVSIKDIPTNLLLRRPDVRTAYWQTAAQSAQIGIAKADLYPSISLFGTIGWSGNSLKATNDVVSVAAGPSVSWDIFNYGRLKNNVRTQDARLQQALEAYQMTVLNAAREIDDAASRVAQTQASQQILDDAVEAAERSLEIATRRYQEGYSDFQRVLDAQATTFRQSDHAITNRGDHIAAIISLYQALGGGWQEAEIDNVIPQSLRELMAERTDWGNLLEEPLHAPTDTSSTTTSPSTAPEQGNNP